MNNISPSEKVLYLSEYDDGLRNPRVGGGVGGGAGNRLVIKSQDK